MNATLTHVAGCLVLAVVGAASSPNVEPRIVARGSAYPLVLPPAVRAELKSGCPGYRVPVPEDAEAAWSDMTPDSLPFATWGDYDGNGFTDVAIIMVDKSYKWKLVVVSQYPEGRFSHVFLRSNAAGNTTNPRLFTLSTLPKGQVVKTERAGERVAFRYGVDAVSLAESEGTKFFFHWDGRGFAEDALGHE